MSRFGRDVPRCARLARKLACTLALLVVPSFASAQQTDMSAYRAATDRLIDAATRDSFAYNRLATFVDKFGNRLSGSESLEHGIDWVLAQMQADGLENVHGESVMVPHWVRGKEYVELTSPRRANLPMLGLGGSIATPPEGIEADVFVVNSFDDLKAHAADVKGRIVVFDVPFKSYGETVIYRANGAFEAQKLGAVASLIRSITPYSMRTPHTGSMRRDSAVTIPGAALTVEDVKMLHRMQDLGEKIRIKLYMEAHMLPDVQSRNVIGEIRGREKPDEVVIVSGHIDSWDVGQGAMDDGGGAIVGWEAVRLMHKLNLRPRRTVRVILWTNEENGARGGAGYAESHSAELAKHVAAIESDEGTFKPRGFAFTGTDSAFAQIQQIGKLLDHIDAGDVIKGGGGTDIAPMMRSGVPGMGLTVEDTKYFWFHHTDADTMDKLDPKEVAQCAAAMAVMSYVLAEMPQMLPHGTPPLPPRRR
jgi:carboxypeptidase Q